MKKVILCVIIYFFFLIQYVPAQSENTSFIAEADSGLVKLVSLKDKIKDVHPLLNNLHPVAIVKGDELYIFDIDSAAARYKFIKKAPVPFPMGEGIKASFPLAVYDWKPTCIAGKEIFNSLSGYSIIFHEFIHCSQYNTVEQEIKNTLEINKKAMEEENFSWELNYAFPYEDSLVSELYEGFITSLENDDKENALDFRRKLKGQLSKTDYEYLIWEEWKEGFARFIENKIRIKFGIKENNGGIEKPFNRVAFYYGGSLFINSIVESEPGLQTDLKQLFKSMFNYPDY